MESPPTKVKAEEVEGLRELITQVILQEWDKVVPARLLQDVEEIRRSPAGAVIRMEGAVERLEEDMAELKRTVATREVMEARFREVDTRFDELEKRMEARFREVDIRFDELEKRMGARFREVDIRFDELEKRINVLRLAFFAFLALQVATLVKLFS